MAIAFHGELYIPKSSWIHRWAVRPKLVSLLALLFAFAMVRHVVLLPWMLGCVALLYGLAQLPLGYLLHRLSYPGLFIIAMVVALPFVAGETAIAQWCWFTLRQEGLAAATLVSGRFLAIVITGFILLGTTPFLDILKALRSLGLPPLLADMTLLTYRYLYDVAAQLATMQQAMRLRCYGRVRQRTRRRWRWLAALFGTLLLRSYERSQRVYQAMCLRGYGQMPSRSQHFSVAADPVITPIATGLTGVITLAFILAEWRLSTP